MKLGLLSAKIITDGRILAPQQTSINKHYGSQTQTDGCSIFAYSQNKCVHYLHIYISTYLHIYISTLHILYLLIVVLANFNLLSRPFIMLPPGRQLASGRSGRHAMHHANLILIDCAGGFLPSICQFANVCFYINLRLGELLANYEASWGQILAPSQ